MNKKITGLILHVFFICPNATFAEDIDKDCDCSPTEYVFFNMPYVDVELQESAWDVLYVRRAIDLEDPNEIERCFVELAMSTRNYTGISVPEGEAAIFDGEYWMLSSDFIAWMEETGCSLTPNT